MFGQVGHHAGVSAFVVDGFNDLAQTLLRATGGRQGGQVSGTARGQDNGQIAGITDNVVTLEIAENVRIKVTRSAIGGSASEAEKPAPAKTGG